MRVAGVDGGEQSVQGVDLARGAGVGDRGGAPLIQKRAAQTEVLPGYLNGEGERKLGFFFRVTPGGPPPNGGRVFESDLAEICREVVDLCGFAARPEVANAVGRDGELALAGLQQAPWAEGRFRVQDAQGGIDDLDVIETRTEANLRLRLEWGSGVVHLWAATTRQGCEIP